MNPRHRAGAGLLAAALALALTGCAGQSPGRAVIITEGRRFAPATLSVGVGERVVWRNRSQDRHAVVVEGAGGGGPVGSPALFHSDEWAHSFDRPGAYRFSCAFHGAEDMVGVLTVVE